MSICFATLLYDPKGRMHLQLQRQADFLFECFDSVAAYSSHRTFAPSKALLQQQGALVKDRPDEISGVNMLGRLRRDSVDLALKTNCEHIFYCDGDRMLHWLEHYPDELLAVINAIQQSDFTVLGRTPRAFRSHPAPLQETENIITYLFTKVSGRAWDTLAAARGMSRQAATSIVQNCTDDAISNDVTWPLLAMQHGDWKLNYLEVEGLEYETADRLQPEISQAGGLSEWLARENVDLDRWLHRLELAKLHIKAMKPFASSSVDT